MRESDGVGGVGDVRPGAASHEEVAELHGLSPGGGQTGQLMTRPQEHRELLGSFGRYDTPVRMEGQGAYSLFKPSMSSVTPKKIFYSRFKEQNGGKEPVEVVWNGLEFVPKVEDVVEQAPKINYKNILNSYNTVSKHYMITKMSLIGS